MTDNSINIAILGNCTTNYIAQSINNECLRHNIHANVYDCAYNQYHQEIINGESEFYKSNPDLSILFLDGKLLFPELYDYKAIADNSNKKHLHIQSIIDSLVSNIETIKSRCNTHIIVNNFIIPYHSPLGILDGKHYPGLRDVVSLINLKLSEWASDKDNIYIFDYCGFCAQFGNYNIYDAKMYYLIKSTTSLAFVNHLAAEYMRYIFPIKHMSKKCLVLDLDNTLWGGIAGEDGISGIVLDISGPGESFYDFQKEILSLYYKGIILAINSKNNLEDALEIIDNHPYMVLRNHNFASIMVNWNDKAYNIKQISQQLNIGTDSMVFFDDNPVERELVKALLPEVMVIDVPQDTSKYSCTLQNIREFELLNITDEDINRNLMYQKNKERTESQQQFDNIDDYLASLETKMILGIADDFSVPRIAQLTQKTNQFNMTSKRYSLADIQHMAQSENHMVMWCQVIDKFCDNGITGVCIVTTNESSAEIDTFLLSCRVLGRNVEYAFLSNVISVLRGSGIDMVYASYIETEKNRPNKAFYERAGFSKCSANETQQEIVYSLDSSTEVMKFEYIECIKSV